MAKFGTDYQGLAHHWVYNDDHSHCYGYRMYSEGDSIYSYGSHFKMAQKIRDKKTGSIICVVVNADSASNTTSKQQWCLRGALPFNWDVIEVSNCEWRNWGKVLEYFKDQYYHFSDKVSKARSRKDEYISEAAKAVSMMKAYIGYAEQSGVKIDKRKIGKFWKDLMDREVTEADVVEAAIQRENERILKAKRKARANRQQHKADLEKLQEWKDLKVKGRVYLPTIAEAHLRVNGDRVETSQGASVSLIEAKVLARKLRRGEDVKGYTIEGFTVISYNGSLKIGCHAIPRKEVESIIDQIQ